MTKTNKRNITFFIVVIELIITVLMILLIGNIGVNTARAEETINDELILKLSDMTNDLFIDVNKETQDIRKYSAYLDDRFQLNNNMYAVQDVDDDICDEDFDRNMDEKLFEQTMILRILGIQTIFFNQNPTKHYYFHTFHLLN